MSKARKRKPHPPQVPGLDARTWRIVRKGGRASTTDIVTAHGTAIEAEARLSEQLTATAAELARLRLEKRRRVAFVKLATPMIHEGESWRTIAMRDPEMTRLTDQEIDLENRRARHDAQHRTCVRLITYFERLLSDRAHSPAVTP